MTAPMRRGACPTLRAPMPTGDGLLVRLMPPDGRLTPAQLGGLAAAAARCGNGLIEITARGSLQVRGLAPETVVPFALAMDALGLAAPEGPVLHVGALSGLDPSMVADPRPLATALRAAPPPAGLSPKIAIVVDGGGLLPLDDVSADIRLVAMDAARWLVALDRTSLGSADVAAVPGAVRRLLAALAALGPAARARDLVGDAAGLRRMLHLEDAAAHPPRRAVDAVGVLKVAGRTIVGLGLPFGQSEATDLVAPADLGATEFRLAPGRVLLAVDAPTGFVAGAKKLGFIVDPADPRRAIAACAGAPRCASGLIDARAIAAALAAALDRPRARHETMHVSGCAKGCAHPGAAALTIVGTAAGAGIIRDGSAGDVPATVVAADQVVAAVLREAVAA